MMSSDHPNRARLEAVRSQSFKGRALDAALRLVEACGAERIKLVDVAAQLETGAASLYYHFRSKEALLAEVAVIGFQALEDAVQAAYDNGAARASLRACGAYLHFIRDRPQLYRLMYSEPVLRGHEIARNAERRAFQRFAGLVSIGESEEARGASALSLWAFGRGVAALAMNADVVKPGEGLVLARTAISGLEALMGASVADRVRGA